MSLFNYLISPAFTGVEDESQMVAYDEQTVQLEQAPDDNLAFDLIGLTQLREDPQFAGIDGSGVSVAVIDTGIDIDHPLIAPNYIAGYDFVDGDRDPSDPDGHGTHVAGIIGAADEAIGVATDVGLIGLRALDSNGTASILKIEDALQWVLDNRRQYNISAVNLSLGMGSFTSEADAWVYGSVISDEIERLEEVGVSLISSTGNNYYTNSLTSDLTSIAYPAISSTLAVGAVWQESAENATWLGGSIDHNAEADRIASFSQRLAAANVIFAPGTNIFSTISGGGIGKNSGTSQASPHVAGAVALLQEASLQFGDRLLAPDEVTEILRSTGDLVFDGDDEHDNVSNTNVGYARVNIYNAVKEIKRRSDNLNLTANNTASLASDFDGTIAGAYTVPDLSSLEIAAIAESIGEDSGNIRDRDVDLYRFDVTALGTLSIEVMGDSESEDFDSYLRLFDAAGSELVANNDLDDTSLLSRLDLNLDRGTYYVGVSGNGNTDYDPNLAGSGTTGSTGDYALEFDFDEQDREIGTIHRFFRSDIGVHFYTVSEAERDAIDANLDHYIYEGESFAAARAIDNSEAKPVYRFFNTSTGAHLYTMSEAERNHIDDNLANYSFEGVAYNGYESDRPGATPLYRFYNSQLDAHFYTPSTAERDAILSNLPDYQLEGNNGIAFYVEPIL